MHFINKIRMAHLTKIGFLGVFMVFMYSCQVDQEEDLVPVEINQEAYIDTYAEKLANDTEFVEFSLIISDRISTALKDDLGSGSRTHHLTKLMNDLQSVTTREEAVNRMRETFKYPKLVMHKSEKAMKYAGKIKTRYPELLDKENRAISPILQKTRQKIVINYKKSLTLKKLNQKSASTLPEIGDHCWGCDIDYDGKCPGCYESYENADDTCFQEALTEGAVCGALAETGPIAIICGLAVLSVHETCESGAENEYGICHQYDCN